MGVYQSDWRKILCKENSKGLGKNEVTFDFYPLYISWSKFFKEKFKN